MALGCKAKAPAPMDAGAPPPTVSQVAPKPAPTDPVADFMQAVDAQRIEKDIRFIAKPRPPGSAHHRAVKERCAELLKKNGFEIFRQPFAGGENVVGTKPGKNDKRIIFSAHFDHIAHCSGADDNASGVALVWEAARVLSRGSFEHTLVLACWDDEESGLYGSSAYAARCKQRKEDVALMISLDGVGFTNDEPGSQQVPPGFERMFPKMGKQLKKLEYRGNFIAVIADTSAAPGLEAIEGAATRAKLPLLGDALGVLGRVALLDAARSDHASFWLQGFPALLVTDTANFRSPYYHCQHGDDAVETLDLPFTVRVGRTLIGALADMLESTAATPPAASPAEAK